ncbi:MAG: HAMP domain-containing sensor histidine kinase, partial [Coriobacteriia bacterium]|nr:HAMP domain-containing sensor histidine kinase [Coriobacteriia bacterium]
PMVIAIPWAPASDPEPAGHDAEKGTIMSEDASHSDLQWGSFHTTPLHTNIEAPALAVVWCDTAHEIRNSLSTIAGPLSVLVRGTAGSLNGEQRLQAEAALQSTRRLICQVEEAFALLCPPTENSIGAGAEPRLDLVRLDQMVQLVAASMEPYARAKSLTLSTRCATGDLNARLDRRRLEQVLVNLISNAVKCTRHGWIEVSVARIEANRLTFSVSDTGAGMPPKHLEQLLGGRTVPANRARSSSDGGLGLAICRQLAGLLGGTLSGTSQPGYGTEIVLTIPVVFE